jgi:riboflavin synthase
MFTGIVTAIGRIASARPHGDGLRLRIDAPGFGMDDVALGDSIALQGVCHTVVAKDAGGFEVDTSAATLAVTTGLHGGREVNLEKSLTLADRLGGHLVSGHVDGVGTVTAFDDLGGSWRLEIEMPPDLSRYVARKGSIAVDGVSLTVNARPAPDVVQISLIPFTLQATTLGERRVGDRVHVEGDMLGKYVAALLEPHVAAHPGAEEEA